MTAVVILSAHPIQCSSVKMFFFHRVRGAALCQHDGYNLLATASSDGAIQIWRIARKDVSKNYIKTEHSLILNL